MKKTWAFAEDKQINRMLSNWCYFVDSLDFPTTRLWYLNKQNLLMSCILMWSKTYSAASWSCSSQQCVKEILIYMDLTSAMYLKYRHKSQMCWMLSTTLQANRLHRNYSANRVHGDKFRRRDKANGGMRWFREGKLFGIVQIHRGLWEDLGWPKHFELEVIVSGDRIDTYFTYVLGTLLCVHWVDVCVSLSCGSRVLPLCTHGLSWTSILSKSFSFRYDGWICKFYM